MCVFRLWWNILWCRIVAPSWLAAGYVEGYRWLGLRNRLPTIDSCLTHVSNSGFDLHTWGVCSYIHICMYVRIYIHTHIGTLKMALDFAATYKVLVLGDSNVGKTCIVHRYCDERYYDTYISTIGEWWHVCCCMPLDCWILLLESLTSHAFSWNFNFRVSDLHDRCDVIL
jgi:hypothetical protein